MTTSKLIAQFSTMRDALDGFLQRDQGRSKDRPTANEAYNKIKNLLNRLKAQQIQQELDKLESAADNLQTITGNINRAIQKIQTTDKDLGVAAKVVNAFGQLASALLSRNSQDIGTALDKLFNIGGF